MIFHIKSVKVSFTSLHCHNMYGNKKYFFYIYVPVFFIFYFFYSPVVGDLKEGDRSREHENHVGVNLPLQSSLQQQG